MSFYACCTGGNWLVQHIMSCLQTVCVDDLSTPAISVAKERIMNEES